MKMEKMRNKVIVYQLIDLDDNGSKVLTGTIEDIRIFMKDRWGTNGDFVNHMLETEFIEEDYYSYIENDENLWELVNILGYMAIEECEVPIEDFFEE